MDWSVFKFLLSSIVVVSLVSCSNNKKIIIESCYTSSYEIVDDNNYLKNKEENKESFLLYLFSTSCLSCTYFKPVLESYIKDNYVKIYALDVDNEKTKLNPNNSYYSYKYTPTLFIISNECKYEFNQETNSKMFVNQENLKNELDKYIVLSNKIEVNTDNDLKEVIKTNNEVFIYYHYKKCGDCVYFENNFFNEYLLNLKKQIFFFEMSYYFSNQEEYLRFADEFYLSKNSHLLGYKKGVVPTLQKYQNGNLISASVIFNDEMEFSYNENNEIISLKILSSYYKDFPYISHIFYNDEKNCLQNYHEKTLSFYKEKVISLLN